MVGLNENWLRVSEGRRIWLEAASVLGFRRSAERFAQKNCPILANPNYDEIALPVPTFGHSGLPAIGLTPNSARQQKSEDWGGLQPNSPAFKNPQPVPWHRRPSFQVPYESPNESHASYTPDTAWPVGRFPPCGRPRG